MLKCSRVCELISEYIDGELDRESKKDFLYHINHCDNCMSEYRVMRNIVMLCNDMKENEFEPKFDFKQFYKAIEKDNKKKGVHWPRMFTIGVAACILIAVVALASSNFGANLPNGQISGNHVPTAGTTHTALPSATPNGSGATNEPKQTAEDVFNKHSNEDSPYSESAPSPTPFKGGNNDSKSNSNKSTNIDNKTSSPNQPLQTADSNKGNNNKGNNGSNGTTNNENTMKPGATPTPKAQQTEAPKSPQNSPKSNGDYNGSDDYDHPIPPDVEEDVAGYFTVTPTSTSKPPSPTPTKTPIPTTKASTVQSPTPEKTQESGGNDGATKTSVN